MKIIENGQTLVDGIGSNTYLAYIGEIKMIASGTAPSGWLLCDGASYTTASKSSLYGVIGYTYGGSGANFNVPDLRGRLPLGKGTGTGLTARSMGASGGGENTTLTTTELPSHNHTFNASSVAADQPDPQATYSLATEPTSATAFYKATTPDRTLISSTIGNSGTGSSFTNMSPFLVINFIIAESGAIP